MSTTTLAGNGVESENVRVDPSLVVFKLTLAAVYQNLGTSILSTVSFIDNRTTYSVSSPEACRILNADRRKFQKPVQLYEILKVFGSNVVVTEGEEWRRHRKVSPGFSVVPYNTYPLSVPPDRRSRVFGKGV